MKLVTNASIRQTRSWEAYRQFDPFAGSIKQKQNGARLGEDSQWAVPSFERCGCFKVTFNYWLTDQKILDLPARI